jgi:AraC-like DNA-binding protein
MSISSTLVQGADIRFQPAAQVLRPFVGCFWVIMADAGATIRVVPDGSTTISCELQTGGTSKWFLRGPLLRPSERRFEAPATVVGIRLRPGVAFILSGIATHSIVDRRISLGRLAAFRSLGRVEPGPHTPAELIGALEQFLIARLQNAAVHPIVSAALREIERAHGCVHAADVALRCGSSARHLNRLMREWVGFGAKRLATIVRFQATLHHMEHSPRESPALLASENGYFDQSHLSIDATRFAGATPGALSSQHVADFSKTRCDDLL